MHYYFLTMIDLENQKLNLLLGLDLVDYRKFIVVRENSS